jgi:hypothetical protein
MTLTVDDELRAICRDLIAEGFSELEWAAREADDWVQSDHYEGGYDATEKAFCFSRYSEQDEAWFQFTLAEAAAIAIGELSQLPVRLAE